MSKCSCCGKEALAGAINRYDKKKRIICYECLSYVPFNYGLASVDDLINFIQIRKRKRWWQFWKS